MNGAGRVDVLGADRTAFTYEGAVPNAIVRSDDLLALVATLVTRIHVVALSQGDRRGPEKIRIKSENWTCCVTEHAVNTH